MHLEGYGCAGTSATAYGVACRELEAVDSGLRSFVSVQGSLAMYAIHRWGSEEQKEEWLPRMATGEAIGCFGLTEPDAGCDPGVDEAPARRAATATTGCSTAPRCGSPTAPSPTSRSSGPRPTTGSAGSSSRPTRQGFSAHKIQRKLSLRASVTAELAFDDLRLPADAAFPEVRGLKGPLSCLNEARYGIVWGVVGAARACLEESLAYTREREQFGKPLASFQLTQRKLALMTVAVNNAALRRLAARRAQGRRDADADPGRPTASTPTSAPRSTSRARRARRSAAPASPSTTR